MSVRFRGLRRVLAVLAGTLCLVAVAAAPASAGELVSSPSNFKIDYGGDIASDGNRLFATVTGTSGKGGIRTQVFARRGTGWKAVSKQFPSTYRGGNNVYFLRFGGREHLLPCFNYVDRKDDARFWCRSGGRWRSLSVAPALRRMGHFYEGSAVNGRLTGFFMTVSRPKDETTTIRIAEKRGWRIVPRGPAGTFNCLCYGAVGQQTEDARSGLVDVALNALSTSRYVVTLGPGGWTMGAPLPEPERPSIVGSQFGPVRTSDNLFVPVHTMSWEEPWTLSVYGLASEGGWSQVGGKDLNLGTRNVQGALVPVGKRVWAMWEEYPPDGTDDPTSIHAARINRNGTGYDRQLELWRGRFGFMSGWDAVEHGGGPVFLYTRSYERDDRLTHLVVDMSHVEG